MKKLFLILFCALALLGKAEARQETLFPSTALTASANGADFIINNEEVLHILVDLTAYTGTGNWTITVEGKWPNSTYYTLLAGTALSANGTQTLKIGRGLTAAANSVANDGIPPIVRVRITISGTTTATIAVFGNFAN